MELGLCLNCVKAEPSLVQEPVQQDKQERFLTYIFCPSRSIQPVKFLKVHHRLTVCSFSPQMNVIHSLFVFVAPSFSLDIMAHPPSPPSLSSPIILKCHFQSLTYFERVRSSSIQTSLKVAAAPLSRFQEKAAVPGSPKGAASHIHTAPAQVVNLLNSCWMIISTQTWKTST